MDQLPTYISLVFILTTIVTVWFFYMATKSSKTTLIVLAIWLVIQGLIAYQGFYTVTDSIPPRFALLVLPPLLFIIGLFITSAGRRYLDSLDVRTLTLLHIVRIPVELVLYWLFIRKVVPQVMTFEGRNFDILSGITAPIILYFGFMRRKTNRKLILLWNIICLGLLINIVVIAVLSAPFPFQKFAFDQPDVAILYFPFVWLPCCIVPLVLLSHLATIRDLLVDKRKTSINKSFFNSGDQ